MQRQLKIYLCLERHPVCQISPRSSHSHGHNAFFINVTKQSLQLIPQISYSVFDPNSLPFLETCMSLNASFIFDLLRIRADTKLFRSLTREFYSEPVANRGAGVRCFAPNLPGLGSHLSENYNLTSFYHYLSLVPKIPRSTGAVQGRELYLSSTSLDPALVFYLFSGKCIPLKSFEEKIESINVQAMISRGELGDCLMDNFIEYRACLEAYLRSPSFRKNGFLKKLNSLTNFVRGQSLKDFPKCGVFLPIIHSYVIDEEDRARFDDSAPDMLCLSPRHIARLSAGRSTEESLVNSDMLRKIRSYCHDKSHFNVETLLLNSDEILLGETNETTLEWILKVLKEAGHLCDRVKSGFNKFLSANVERLLDYDLGVRMFLDDEQHGGSSLDSHQEVFTSNYKLSDLIKADETAQIGKRTFDLVCTDSQEQEMPALKKTRLDRVPVLTPPPDLSPDVEITEATLNKIFSTLRTDKVVVFPTSSFFLWHDFCKEDWVDGKFTLSLNQAAKRKKKLFNTRKSFLPKNFKDVSHLVFPVYYRGHWSTIIFEVKGAMLYHIDSLYAPKQSWLKEMSHLVKVLLSRSLKVTPAPSLTNRPMQPSGTVDCGAFAFYYTQNLLAYGSGHFDFQSCDMSLLRQKLTQLWLCASSK